MLTSENDIRLCNNCPNRAEEGTYHADLAAGVDVQYPATGNLVARQATYMNARGEFIRDAAETPDISSQELGVVFVDTEGNRTSAFLPGVQLEAIAKCKQPVLISRSGFLWRNRTYDCGAQILELAKLRQAMNTETS